MSELQRPLEKSDVHLVPFIVDPEKRYARSPARLCRQNAKRAVCWDFLTGPRDTIAAISRDGFKLGISEGEEPASGPFHSARFALVDRPGTIRGYHDALAPDGVTKLLADTNHLLRAQSR